MGSRTLGTLIRVNVGQSERGLIRVGEEQPLTGLVIRVKEGPP